MKSKRIRTTAKVFLWVGVVLLLASFALTFAYLTTLETFPLEFANAQLREFVNEHLHQWEYPTVVGGTSALLLILALILACVARRCERDEYDTLCENAFCCMEDEYDFEPIAATEDTKSVKDVMGAVGAKLKDKKALAIGVAALSALTVGALAVSVSSNVKHAKQAKRRREFYKWLG